MIARIIDWSARNLLPGAARHRLRRRRGVLCPAAIAARRAARTCPTSRSSSTPSIPGQAPQVVEDQVTYPLTTAMLGGAEVARWCAASRSSARRFVYVIFEDGTDIYWARSRVLEYLNFAARPPAAGRDAARSGPTPPASAGSTSTRCWRRTGRWPNCARIQDWYRALPAHQGAGRGRGGERSAASCKQYQVIVDPRELRGLRHPADARWREVIRDSATATSAAASSRWPRPSTWCAARGYLRGIADIENLVLKADGGTPVLVRDVARVELGAGRAARHRRAERRRRGRSAASRWRASAQNALDVIDNVKAKIEEIAAGLPEGVTIEPVYDRSDLIHRAIDTLKRTLIEESLIVALVCVVFLLHVRSALVAILMLPVGVLIAVHRDAAAGHQLQHHEPGRHRDRHRRAWSTPRS
ncbi:MAG: efflux RND transporter permease subunit [Rhodopseudomonas palustris]|nr:efflux RND transporter permease subunit [Rhodopseudomonas palustris]